MQSNIDFSFESVKFALYKTEKYLFTLKSRVIFQLLHTYTHAREHARTYTDTFTKLIILLCLVLSLVSVSQVLMMTINIVKTSTQII